MENSLDLYILDVMMLIYRFKVIVVLVNKLLYDWTIVDLDWEGWACPNANYMIV